MKTIPIPNRFLNFLAAVCFLALTAGIARAAAPGIAVKDPDNTDLAYAASAPFPSATLPDIALGGSITKSFTIKNTGDAVLTIADIVSSSGQFAVSGKPATVAASGSETFQVKFQPTASGNQTGTITITSDVASKSPFKITVKGKGLAPKLSVEQPAGHSITSGVQADFGSVTNNFSKEIVFTIRNPGDANLEISTFSFADPLDRTFLITDPAPISVPGGGFDTFTARFSPSALGDYTAKLTIASNAGSFIINLKGSKVASELYQDAFGYICTEQAGGNPAPFIEASDPDVIIDENLTGIDKYSQVDMGFPFRFYDKTYSRCSISTTGLITFDGTSVNFRPGEIAKAAAPNNFIAPLWTDMKIDNNSRILYKTSGTAPDRIFIVKFENAFLYDNGASSTGRVTFQVQLQESTNSILIRYDTADTTKFPIQDVTVGIESRNYGTDDASRPGAGLVGNEGVVGVQYRHGLITEALQRPAFPSTIVFTRPVIVTVESKYAKPAPAPGNPAATVDTIAGENKLKPFGVIYGSPRNKVLRFEAPEYIYLDKDFNEIDSITDFSDPTVSGTALYRLVNDGYAIDGQVIQGTHTFFTTTLDHDVTVIWRWKLEYAAIVQAVGLDGNPLNVGEGIGAPDPGFGRHWVPKDTEFSASIARTVGDGILGADLSGFRFNTKSYTMTIAGGVESGPQTVAATGDRVATTPVTIKDWVLIKWKMAAQIRYRFDAGGGNLGDSSTQFLGQAFVRVGDPPGATQFAVATSNTVWIDSGSKVEIGAFYRTADRCYTLANFPASPGGDLTSLGTDISVLPDVMMDDAASTSRVARVFTIAHVSTPTEVHFLYAPTVFRAEIPLGQSFDATLPYVQLVPRLCDGAVLRKADLGPSENFTRVGDLAPGTATGTPVRWDQVGQQLFPVQPGSYQIEWPDANTPSKSYKIEIVTGYPGDTARLATAREQKLPNGDSIRSKDAGGVYIFTTDLGRVDPDFPGSVPSPGADAHYRHLFDPKPDRQAPTKLDISTSDEWAFNQLTYTDKGTGANVDSTPAKAFTVTGAGRSVLLYSYRPNPDEAADGTLSKEALAVRVVRSSELAPIIRTNPQLVLGQHGLMLGKGETTSDGAFGVIQTGASPAASAILAGDKFVMDFWLNAKGLKDSASVSLTNCKTIAGSTTVTCASTAGLVVEMAIGGTNIPAGARVKSITNATTLVLSAAATGTKTGLALTASNAPVTVVSTGSGNLKVTLDAQASTITANYRGVPVVHALPKAGAGWRHYIVHAFTYTLFGTGVTVVDFYRDGIRAEKSFITSWFPGDADSAVGTAVDANSLRFGANANSRGGLMIDQFRLFGLGADPNRYLTGGELRLLRTQQNMTLAGKPLRSVGPQLWFNFEGTPAGGFANFGSLANVKVGPVSGSGIYADTWANVDLQEVASRIDSTLDNAGFEGSGYIQNVVSNYNPDLYDRSAEVGTWGPVFPVNHKQLFTADTKRLDIAYYENPYRTDRLSNPNVAWPYVSTKYEDVVFPTVGPNKDKRIYIASRIGSEGVDRTGKPQDVFDLSNYAGLKIYNQPDLTKAGYNLNEEHALVAASGRAALKVKNLGDGIPNNPPLAAFALQKDANQTTVSYTSEPWVLVEVNNTATGEPEMAAYYVEKTRTGTIPFPRPTDAKVSATPGLAYESADNPDDRFLTLDPSKTFDFSYGFEYPIFAGDLVIPPYPLNIVIGNIAMQDERGGNIQVNGINRRTLWRDVNKHGWAVSGDGRFFNQFFYPMRGDFYLPGNPSPGTPVAWLPTPATFTGPGTSLQPVKVLYNSKWRSDYPKLKRGETLTYQGGEYFSENPGSNGLPALVAMKAAELVYDSSTPDMVIHQASSAEVAKSSAQIIRPLDRREVTGFSNLNMSSSGFSPAETAKLLIIAERWYFKDLPGSLGKKFYYDSLAAKLVFRGYLNDKDSGASDLTSGPDPLNILEPNVMTKEEYDAIRALSDKSVWTAAIDGLYKLSQNPNQVTSLPASVTAPVFLQGVKPPPAGGTLPEVAKFWKADLSTTVTTPDPVMARLDSFGVGAALVPNASLLTTAPNGSLYVTIAENNRAELDGAPVSLHIIEIIPDRYRGAIKVVESQDAFSEKVMLLHNADFGANTADIYYEWWIRDAAPLDLVATEILPNGNLAETDSSGHTLWQQYLPKARLENGSLTDSQKHQGLNSIVFEGRPDVVLADKLVLMRYRYKNESNWNLVPFEFNDASKAWKPGDPAPFQWAGAANSPQLQADGSKRYIPQLVMGWVKRVLDRINPYEARYTDFFSNEHPATYSSQIQIAGGPFAGKVALNPDKNVIENTGLIELYETVLQRAKELSIDNSSNPVSTDGINQALLLAATRLSVLYELLGSEAYSDAQDPTITVTDDSGLASVASFTFAFQNFEPDLLHEELSLLRGTDFRKSYPVYNRLFWNYAKGLGEAAYNVNYNIHDVNRDGFINEDDARKLFPQGHGDAWGHYVNALDKSYDLLRAPNFNWRARSELYSLMQNVLEVDFLDEKTFARLAGEKARTGRDIVRGTYRLKYTQDPDGEWQGYTDGVDPARAWGVSEWAHRAGQGAYFDWAVANSLLPEDASGATPVPNPEGLDRIERQGAIDDVSGIAGSFYEIQNAMDEADGGVNPLGFDTNAIAFDLDPFYDGESWERETHFEQIYDRAVVAGNNALTTLGFATQVDNKLRKIADDTNEITADAFRQDLDYRNRLIEIFGRPYDGTIGFGKAFPEGYDGPDNLLFAYLDRTKVDQIIPTGAGSNNPQTLDFNDIKSTVSGLASNGTLLNIYNETPGGSGTLTNAVQTYIAGHNYEDPTVSFSMPVARASDYAFQSPPEWGQRTSYGKLQNILGEMLSAEVELKGELDDYAGFLGDFETLTRQLLDQIEVIDRKEGLQNSITATRASINATFVAIDTAIAGFEIYKDITFDFKEAATEAIPGVVGFSTDVLAPVRAGIAVAASVAREPVNIIKKVTEVAKEIADLISEEVIDALERKGARAEYTTEISGMMAEIEKHTGSDGPKRAAIGATLQNLEMLRQEYITAQAEGFRLLREREMFNKTLAAKVQANRYQDMVLRLSRNEAMGKYQSAFNNAARYAWLAAKAYDYETSLDPGDPAAAGPVFDQIVKERQLGLWTDGEPAAGQGGLAEILNHLAGNFAVLKGQLGLNNPQPEMEKISLRGELMRIGPAAADGGDAASDDRWKDALNARIVPDLNQVPEFVRYCRPFANAGSGPQPGLVIRFATSIEPGLNVFGLPLMPGDHNYSTANFATKIRGFGVWLDNYNAAGLATTPRAYLIPTGTDFLRTSNSAQPFTRAWSVNDQRIPTPFVLNPSSISAPGFIPTLNGVDGSYGEPRRYGDFRIYHDNGDPDADDSELVLDSRLVGRSVWNSGWMLVIPGAALDSDPTAGLSKLTDTVEDIKLHFRTYSHQGQ